MSKIGFIFPGQGAQVLDMGKDIIEKHRGAKEVFDKANALLDFDLYELCFTENDLLNDTAYTQPALLTVSMALYEGLKEAGIKADYVAGLSLGEYSALVASNVFSLEDGVRLVRERGKLMQEAAHKTQGGMAAIIGSSKDEIEAILDKVEGYVTIANYNSPKQIVVAGSLEALEEAYPLFETAKIKAIPLVVSGAFHSELMAYAAEGLAHVLEPIKQNKAETPYFTNVTGDLVVDEEKIKDLLVRQVKASVKWEDCVTNMIKAGVDTFVEIGPGKTLAGLIKKIDRKVTVLNVSDAESLSTAISALKA